MDNGYLAHYGVKGMKWNIRKKQEELSERILALNNRENNQRVKYKLTDLKDRSSLEKTQEKAIDQQSNEELITDIENRKKEIIALTNDLINHYKEMNLKKINVRNVQNRAALMIKKFKIKKAAII